MNEKGKQILTCLSKNWWACIDNWKLNAAMQKDDFLVPFINQVLSQLARHSYFYFLDGYSSNNQIVIHLDDQEKSTFICPFGTFAFRRMSFTLLNTLMTVQICMTSIFSKFLGDSLEVFMDNFLVFGDDFHSFLTHLKKILEVCIKK